MYVRKIVNLHIAYSVVCSHKRILTFIGQMTMKIVSTKAAITNLRR